MDLRKLNEWPHLLCSAIEFLTLLVFLVEKWLVSRFSGSKEADLHFSLGSFSGHYLVSSDDQSAWSIYTKYSLDDVVFVLWGRFNLFIAAWLGQWDFFLFFFHGSWVELQSKLFDDDNICVSYDYLRYRCSLWNKMTFLL